MPKTVEITAYRFPELSSRAKERVKAEHANVWGYSWSNEAMESLKALAKHFGGEMTDWSVDYFGGPSSVTFRMPECDDDALVLGAKIMELGSFNPDTLKGHGDCKLTGVCFDEDAIDGMRRAFVVDGERDLDKLMQAAFRTWIKSVHSDCEYQYSDEAFGETCDANEYWFDASGHMIPRVKRSA
jgi:hypothetical protein